MSALVFFLIVCFGVIYGLNDSAYSNNNEDLNRVNKAVRTALIECYAIEGAYPEDFDYLKENYALHINHDKYRINYNYAGSNIMPNIVVYRKGDV